MLEIVIKFVSYGHIFLMDVINVFDSAIILASFYFWVS